MPDATDPGEGVPGEEVPAERDPLDLARDVTDRDRRTTPDPTGRPPRRRRRPALGGSTRTSRDEPISVSDALGELIRQQGWEGRLDAQRVFSDWESIVGPEVARHSTVVGFAEAVVHVQTDSTAWAKELRLLAPRIVARLNDTLGDGTVLRIDVRGPEAPSWKSGPWSVKGRGPRDTYG